MASCPSFTIDSNITGLSYAEEECLGVLPIPTVWRGLEPNSYSDFGGAIETVARTPIDPSRQNKKGTISDMNANSGFNTDLTQSNMTDFMQGFFFADAREPLTTKPINGGAPVVITSVDNSTKRYIASSGLDDFEVGMLVLAKGFGEPANNGLKVVTGSDSAYVEVSDTGLEDEVSPSVDASLECVGFEFEEDDLVMAVSSGLVSLTSTIYDFSANDYLFPGLWIYIGGDDADASFATGGSGFARIRSIEKNRILLDEVTWSAVADNGTGKAIQIWLPKTIKNEDDPSLIKRRSYQFERTLGKGPTDTQAEYVVGCIPNEFSVSIPSADKITADLGFVALDEETRSGESGDKIKAGTRIPALGEDAFNTSNNVVSLRMSLYDPLTSYPKGLFAYVTEANVSINNGATPQKAVGILGSLDVSSGNFEVSGSATAYFVDVEAKRAVRQNADVSFHVIVAHSGRGIIFDVPLVGLGASALAVDKDAPITIPIEANAAQNHMGYTASYSDFSYLPQLAMPT